jgi:hypothetical protein
LREARNRELADGVRWNLSRELRPPSLVSSRRRPLELDSRSDGSPGARRRPQRGGHHAQDDGEGVGKSPLEWWPRSLGHEEWWSCCIGPIWDGIMGTRPREGLELRVHGCLGPSPAPPTWMDVWQRPGVDACAAAVSICDKQ